nr:GvpL/GvpF family gas vesicle protein [Natrarchaeobius chitinivorans]
MDDGRYLYCLVRANEGATFETTGVDGEPVSIVVENGVGVVVHSCDGLYDTADLAQIRRWLVRHQTVVDEAGERFGTPVPFQFDTILRGGDDALREWLREESETVARAVSALADHWEYRVEVVETDPVADETLVERDDRLQELEAKIDDAGEGTAYLLETQFDRRLEERRASRRESIAGDLERRLDEVAREVHALERSKTATLSDEVTSESGGSATNRDDDAGDDRASEGTRRPDETVARLTLLAHEDDEAAIGSILDDVAATDGLEVRFTGPWPPYTFAPELGGRDSSGRRRSDAP